MIKIDARGDTCPLPVVKAKKAIAELHGSGEVEVLVDNEIAVQNLTKMAKQKGCQSTASASMLEMVGNDSTRPKRSHAPASSISAKSSSCAKKRQTSAMTSFRL